MSSAMSRRLAACGAALIGIAASVLAAATPAAAVPGLVVVSATSSVDLGGYKAVAPPCPPGTKVLGGGGQVLGGGDSVHLYRLQPTDNQDIVDWFTVAAVAHDPSYPISAWSVTGWAICASGVTGHTVVRADVSAPATQTFSQVTAACPAGKKVIGSGGAVKGAAFVLDSVIVAPTLGSVTVEGFRAEYPFRTVGMEVSAYAVCVDPVPGLQLVSVGSSSSQHKVLTVACPAGTRLHGTGASLSGAGGQAYLEAVAPWGTYGAIVSAREDATGHSGTWTAAAYAICAP